MSTAPGPRTLALAGVFQATRLTQQLAREGRADRDALAASIGSILEIDAPDPAAVFGGVPGVKLGLELLRDKLNAPAGPTEVEMARYAMALIQLERSLSKRADMLARIGQGIESAKEQMRFFEKEGEESEPVHPRLIEKLAALYTDTISTLTPRIMVSGEHGHLNNPAIAARVRAALLAGIRAAVLWRQLGGRRWHLMLMRGRIAREAEEFLSRI